MMRFKSKIFLLNFFSLKRAFDTFINGFLGIRSLRSSAQARVEKFGKYRIPYLMKNRFKILLDSANKASLEANGENVFLQKKSAGFTLIEVLLALAIIGMVLTPIFLIQQMVLRRSSSRAHLFSRLIQAKDFLVDQQFENMQEPKEVTAEKKITNPITTLTFNSRKLPENSALKNFKHIMVDSVNMQWEQDRKKRQEKLVTFSFKPEEQKQ